MCASALCQGVTGMNECLEMNTCSHSASNSLKYALSINIEKESGVLLFIINSGELKDPFRFLCWTKQAQGLAS